MRRHGDTPRQEPGPRIRPQRGLAGGRRRRHRLARRRRLLAAQPRGGGRRTARTVPRGGVRLWQTAALRPRRSGGLRPHPTRRTVRPSPEAFQSWLHAGSSSIMRRSALEAIGGYDEQQRIAVDFDLWLRLARHYRFVATSEITANWRWHEAQLSATPLAQILAVRRYRHRFLRTLRAEGEDSLAGELEPWPVRHGPPIWRGSSPWPSSAKDAAWSRAASRTAAQQPSTGRGGPRSRASLRRPSTSSGT